MGGWAGAASSERGQKLVTNSAVRFDQGDTLALPRLNKSVWLLGVGWGGGFS